MRVAVTQFATTLNIQENLAACLRVINEAAVCKPSLIILPEYCNTLFCSANSGYVDHNQAWEQALSSEGDFLQRIAEQANKYDCYIVLNVTLRRESLNDLSKNIKDDAEPSVIKGNISVTSCLFSPLGKLINQVDKQMLTGYENEFFTRASKVSNVITTTIGKLGVLAGSDDMTFDVSRRLALSEAQLLCHSMSSFSLDQTRLHGPARAWENNVFFASANKIGSLVSLDKKSQEQVLQEDSKQDKSGIHLAKNVISQKELVGVGQSQIISPDGKVLAKIPNEKEGFAFADVDLAAYNINKKLRPDGTVVIKQRRTELYRGLTLPIYPSIQRDLNNEISHSAPATANVAIFATYKSNEQAIEDVGHYIENNVSDIIQLPELFFIADKTITNNPQQLVHVEDLSKQLIRLVSSVLRPFQYVCTSLVIEGTHQAVLISEHGIIATQQQLHFCKRYQWTSLGDEVNLIELPLEQGVINVAMLTADDANMPEIVSIAALKGIQVLLVPFDIQEPCEVEYGLLARAAEHRICIVAASREKSFVNDLPIKNSDSKTNNKNKIKSQKSTGFIANLTTDFTLSTPCKSDGVGGYINQPRVKYQHGKITKAVIHPNAAENKLLIQPNVVLSLETYLMCNRTKHDQYVDTIIRKWD